MAVSMTKGQTSTSDHRSSRLQEMSWNDIQRPGCVSDLRLRRSRASAAGRARARPFAAHHDHLDRRNACRRTVGQTLQSQSSVLRAFAADNELLRRLLIRESLRPSRRASGGKTQAVRRHASTCLSHRLLGPTVSP